MQFAESLWERVEAIDFERDDRYWTHRRTGEVFRTAAMRRFWLR